MSCVNNILVVLDSDKQQQKALNRALHLARISQASVTLMLSIYDFSYEMTTMLAADERNSMRDSLINDRKVWIEDLLEDYNTRELDISIKVLWHNRPYEAIIETAITGEHDIIVKATHAHEGLAHLIFTPTDWHLLRKAPCHVLLVKEHEWPENGKVLAAIHTTGDNDHHDSLNYRITESAQRFANCLHSEVHLVNAYPGAPVTIAAEIPEFDTGNYREVIAENHQQALAKHAQRFSIPESRQHVREGLPEQVIPELAEELDAELVVLGTIGRTGLSAALLGNTAEHVIEQINCDLLAVKPAGFESPVKV
ncbi:universal stress protein UspE [Pseudidiomarina terrestris]|uniref:Universal stress protein UspE n=1 Tax=Pseudidiomarina terrestris TaxID=2820060 RepID=A0AAW7QUV1_9GAMM|nr:MULTISPECIES: universal stress protein UspE [unclassified Pseudidiomarina]MDN7123673.1 universal stress protein UspE [Pseudidiomarina sp. 1APP75-32.1]MDN7126537.1 universal stress protein UspE [Pseudidiomarina sp. 1APR75-33.1]MDN7135138.1 universal stress protein UspE [Pseudidiomarina sp. 1ASP75-5]MDN7137809.1 universal stress protein UspE [Pseudidiomarina sp. 1ASP75-14]MEA3587083.1 universal stress protein UspE [Pseudidiomarina sp. 1APP75-27a]